ncbi:galectin-12 isoform X2 [Neovison vison]|uniref:galectin-12 isoform X2 n=1 Tax=Neovison vison TaxID=452646 RepID=UPI001CEFBB60|nr:galectin-12 isoform X2 [Neogale vison]
MSPGEKLDPLPDPFILQPPIFHPVSVNGQHFLHYRYRLPLSRVDTLGIFGDILVEAIGFLNISPFAEGGSEYPVGYPFLLKSPSLYLRFFCARPGARLQNRGTSQSQPSSGSQADGETDQQTGHDSPGCTNGGHIVAHGPREEGATTKLSPERPGRAEACGRCSINEDRGALLVCPSPGSLARTGHRAAGAGLAGAQGLHTEPAGRGRSRARDAPGFLRRQNSGLDLALGVQEADLSPLPLLSTAILRGAAPVPAGRAEAGTQWAGPGRHQPPAADPGATAGAPGQWQCPALLHPLLRSEPGTPPGKGRAMPGTPWCSSALHPSLNRVPVTTTRVCRGFGSHSTGKAPPTRGPLPQEPGTWFSPPAGPRQGGTGAAS